MAYWLLKTEPVEYSIDDLERSGERAVWDGIRNHQARNYLRDDVSDGDEVLIYHSGKPAPEIVGSAVVVGEPYPDPAQFNADSRYFDQRATEEEPRWYCCDLQFTRKFSRPLLLATIRETSELHHMALVRQGRLSVVPVSAPEWEYINNYCNP